MTLHQEDEVFLLQMIFVNAVTNASGPKAGSGSFEAIPLPVLRKIDITHDLPSFSL
jgi:hypothetical protein